MSTPASTPSPSSAGGNVADNAAAPAPPKRPGLSRAKSTKMSLFSKSYTSLTGGSMANLDGGPRWALPEVPEESRAKVVIVRRRDDAPPAAVLNLSGGNDDTGADPLSGALSPRAAGGADGAGGRRRRRRGEENNTPAAAGSIGDHRDFHRVIARQFARPYNSELIVSQRLTRVKTAYLKEKQDTYTDEKEQFDREVAEYKRESEEYDRIRNLFS
eukprot:GFYU01032373.1.p1 GENE.GFYU01032373.1~~GFYU01032373.1.p1  ORF type:complete len:215 (+),score=37.75 GFYU01032373.1:181-825(+)